DIGDALKHGPNVGYVLRCAAELKRLVGDTNGAEENFQKALKAFEENGQSYERQQTLAMMGGGTTGGAGPANPVSPLTATNVPGSGKEKDKWALVVGISKFANPQYNLKYAAKDAQDFYNFLVNEANFRRDHVVLLLNEQATRHN